MPLASLLSHFRQGVLIATSHQLILAAMQAVADLEAANVLSLTPTYAEALHSLKRRPYELLICTQALQSGSGIALVNEAKRLNPDLPVLFFLTTRMESAVLRQANLYCNALIAEWDLDHDELPLSACLNSLIQQNTTYRSPSIRHLLDAETPQLHEALTPREQSVLNLILAGQSNQEIARSLVLSPSTAKSYSRDVMRKLGVKNRQQAVLRAIELGMLDPQP